MPHTAAAHDDDPMPVPHPHHHTADEARDHELGVLMAHMRMANAQLADFTSALHQVTSRLIDGDNRMERIEKILGNHVEASAKRHADTDKKIDTMAGELAENTATTAVVRDAITTGKTLRRWLVWAGGIVGALGAIVYGVWQALQVLGHRGPPGPTP